MHNIAYNKQQCTNAFIIRSVLHNVNKATTARILPRSAECNAALMLQNIAYDKQQWTSAFT